MFIVTVVQMLFVDLRQELLEKTKQSPCNKTAPEASAIKQALRAFRTVFNKCVNLLALAT